MISVEQLAAAADVNFVTHAGWVQRHLASMTVSERHGLTVIDSGLPCDTFNFVSAARLTTAEARTRAREVLSYFGISASGFSTFRRHHKMQATRRIRR